MHTMVHSTMRILGGGTYLTTINVISNKKYGLFDEGTPVKMPGVFSGPIRV